MSKKQDEINLSIDHISLGNNSHRKGSPFQFGSWAINLDKKRERSLEKKVERENERIIPSLEHAYPITEKPTIQIKTCLYKVRGYNSLYHVFSLPLKLTFPSSLVTSPLTLKMSSCSSDRLWGTWRLPLTLAALEIVQGCKEFHPIHWFVNLPTEWDAHLSRVLDRWSWKSNQTFRAPHPLCYLRI